jgi:ABC-2 type transport system ATP-binding protein
MNPIERGENAEDALDVRGVSKMYGRKVRALIDVSIRVRRGEVFGLLGPNGAGKSTLVKILTTVIRPSTASGHVLGRPIGDKPTLARLGYLPEHHRFPEYLTGRQVVEFYGALAGVPARERRLKAGELIEFVGMKDWADRKVGQYSKGMRQRIGLAQAMVNNPDLIILDEPTDGVDPVGRREIREMVLSMRGQGRAVFINSHLLSELELVCDRVAILVKGKVAAQGTIAELTDHRRRYEIEVEGGGDEGLVAIAGEAGLSGRIVQGVLIVPTAEPAAIQPLLDKLRARGRVIAAVRPVRPSLEDLFMEAVSSGGGTPGADLGSRRAG